MGTEMCLHPLLVPFPQSRLKPHSRPSPHVFSPNCPRNIISHSHPVPAHNFPVPTFPTNSANSNWTLTKPLNYVVNWYRRLVPDSQCKQTFTANKSWPLRHSFGLFRSSVARWLTGCPCWILGSVTQHILRWLARQGWLATWMWNSI